MVGVPAAGEVEVLGEEGGTQLGDRSAVPGVEQVVGSSWLGAAQLSRLLEQLGRSNSVSRYRGDPLSVVPVAFPAAPSQGVPQQGERVLWVAGRAGREGEDFAAGDVLAEESVV